MELIFLDLLAHCVYEWNRRQHPRLGGFCANVRQHTIELSDNELRREFDHPLHTECVLGSDCSENAGPIHAERHESFQIGLDTCAAAAVGTRDCQCLCYSHGLYCTGWDERKK